jgi:ESCRT-I complex subunit VPS28
MALYQLDCPRATHRLLTMGVPEPIRSSEDDGTHHYITVTVAETVQRFITAMDAVKLDQRAVDDLQPYLSDLSDALARLPGTPKDFAPQSKVDSWVQKFNSLRAVDEISEEDARQLLHDLGTAYDEFGRYLKTNK